VRNIDVNYLTPDAIKVPASCRASWSPASAVSDAVVQRSRAR
jgi:hypothetical protein